MVMEASPRPRRDRIEIAETLRRYRLGEVHGDRYRAGWVREYPTSWDHLLRFQARQVCRVSGRGALFAQGRIEILDHPLLARELKLLERRPRQVAVTALTIHGSHDHASALCLATALSVSMRPHLGEGDLVNEKPEGWIPVA